MFVFLIVEGGFEDKLVFIVIVNFVVIDENDNFFCFKFFLYEFEFDGFNDIDIGWVIVIDDDLGLGGIVKFWFFG